MTHRDRHTIYAKSVNTKSVNTKSVNTDSVYAKSVYARFVRRDFVRALNEEEDPRSAVGQKFATPADASDLPIKPAHQTGTSRQSDQGPTPQAGHSKAT